MTSNVQLLPLPVPNGSYTNPYDADDMTSYALANTEALRAEVQFLRSHRPIARKLAQAEAHAERLAEALRDLLDQLEGVGIYIPDEDSGQWAGTEGLSFTQAETALHLTAAQERDNVEAHTTVGRDTSR